ncbi:MAG: hypothetical protein DWQ34_00530 [Planctomycetota bacterium]|nr:MAG: hypothetical protein DWQ29_04550 [Planctomycetota bacterium]REJ98516.1 MAG: hypothetical protein DWQ34_00530 [Planctomycetota bacterium]REK23666.1 MAG: hypothetical protein DWQ41_16190 [Planctomycetota bacterium]REK31204.1 MAG: hypothetical protein DWQ45_20335 [Planctomycetota bacterium]
MPPTLPRCEVIPLTGHHVSLRIDGVEQTRWNAAGDYPRPCFFPLRGPESRESLTRMGHPGAPNHDHHQSVWFAHNKLLGIDFWSNNSRAQIRQQQWLVYEDGDEAAAMAVLLGWYDGHDAEPLVEQELIAFLRPAGESGYTLETHSTFRPVAEQIEFQQTNFGFFAVRVARSISTHFGGGQLTNSEGAVGEPDIFGKPARWMDYSGPMPADSDAKARASVIEGITYFDHPSNPGFPNSWHVREDGWMGCSPCMHSSLTTTRDQPLVLRYLLHVHSGELDAMYAEEIAEEFSSRPSCRVVKSTAPHQQFKIERISQ